MSAIRTTGLSKRYGETVAVDDLSVTVESGEVFGMLGPNGAGKSTLIGMLCTLSTPTDGEATVNGYDIRSERDAVRDSIGVVFQEPALDEELTAAENLAFHARMYGLSREERRERIGDLLDLVELADVADDPVGEYSGGMKRRLEIARGLIHEPEVLFLDEPTLGLDAQTRRATWRYIERMNDERGVTVVLTTHYMEEADHLCDRVAIVDDGNVIALDTPTTLKAQQGGDMLELGLEGDVVTLTARLEDTRWVESVTATDAGVQVALAGDRTRVPDVVRLADETGVTITAVEVHRPSLETVFLALTGNTIAEAAAEGKQ